MKLQYTRTEKAKRLGLRLKKAHDDDVGYDLCTCLHEDLGVDAILLRPHEIRDIGTGISISIQPGYWAEIKARGSSFKNKKLHLHDAVWDSNYRGELQVAVKNMGDKPIVIKDGQRLAQIIFHQEVQVESEEVDELPSSDRGHGCMGSTGE